MAARIGIVGAGIMGQLRAQSVKRHPGAELAAVMDPQTGLASRLTAGTKARACVDLESFMDTKMDAVLVSEERNAVPSGWLLAGQVLYCEVPAVFRRRGYREASLC